jgi:hypothetical protein
MEKQHTCAQLEILEVKKENEKSQMPHAYNPSYLGG